MEIINSLVIVIGWGMDTGLVQLGLLKFEVSFMTEEYLKRDNCWLY